MTLVWRWLLAKGRQDQFRRDIEFGARWTGVKLDQSLLTGGGEMEEVNTEKLITEREVEAEPKESKEVGFTDILRSKTLLPRLLVSRGTWRRV